MTHTTIFLTTLHGSKDELDQLMKELNTNHSTFSGGQKARFYYAPYMAQAFVYAETQAEFTFADHANRNDAAYSDETEDVFLNEADKEAREDTFRAQLNHHLLAAFFNMLSRRAQQ